MTSKETKLDELQWRSPEWVNAFGLRTDNVLEYFSQSPFFDRTSNNQVLKMQNQFTDLNYMNRPYDMVLQDLKKMKGLEFIIAMVREPDFWIIRKQNRFSEIKTESLADYYIIGSSVYMAPLIHSILSSRLLSTVLNLRNAVTSLQEITTLNNTSVGSSTVTNKSTTTANKSNKLTETKSSEVPSIPDSSVNAFKNLLNLSLQNNSIYLDDMPETGITESAIAVAHAKAQHEQMLIQQAQLQAEKQQQQQQQVQQDPSSPPSLPQPNFGLTSLDSSGSKK